MIDFHTHMFPDKMAASTLDVLSSKFEIPPFTDGTVSGLRASQKEAGIDISIVLPIVTKLSQFQSLNRFASQFLEGDIISFGGIHPSGTDYKSELNELKSMGFKGIKLHPAYQGVPFNNISYKRIVSYASELGFIISVHGGYDPGYPDRLYATPKMAAEVFEETKAPKLVMAHFGGFMCWDDAEQFLVGKDIYLDTSACLGLIEDEQFMRICRNHGTDKILFGTDSPWEGQKETVRHLHSLPFTENEKDMIFDKNARKLLTL
ncbi:MAG: TatD family hydrolase [Muricomes sp.]